MADPKKCANPACSVIEEPNGAGIQVLCQALVGSDLIELLPVAAVPSPRL